MVALTTNETGLASVAQSVTSATLEDKNVTPLIFSAASWGLGTWAILTGDDKKIAELYDAGNTVAKGYVTVLGDRIWGVLAQKLGKYEESAAHFEEALSFSRNGGYRPELAWTCFKYGEMLLERDSEGDKAKATSLLDESLKLSSDLGMRPLIERVLSRREILKA